MEQVLMQKENILHDLGLSDITAREVWHTNYLESKSDYMYIVQMAL